jgi:hypothetical protein
MMALVSNEATSSEAGAVHDTSVVQPDTFLPLLLALAIAFFVIVANPVRVAAAVVRGGVFSACMVHFAAIVVLPLALDAALPLAFVLYLIWPTWWLFISRIGLAGSGGRTATFLAMSIAWLLFAPSACTTLALSLGARM